MQRKFHIIAWLWFGVYLLSLPAVLIAQPETGTVSEKHFDLSGEPSPQNQYYTLESRLSLFALDGRITEQVVFRLALKAQTAQACDTLYQSFTCLGFKIQFGDSLEVTVPAMTGWTYQFINGVDSANRVFGIDHRQFENLKDHRGIVLRQDYTYHVYNAFIDFHAFAHVFALPTTEGQGVQHLQKIGQKLVHASAHSQAPTHLGSNIADGSYFRSGEITLEFKGIGRVNDQDNAIIGFDSGESSFKMIMKLTDALEVVTIGRSHYCGDIYKGLSSNWAQKICFNETVISETTLPMPPNKIHSVAERTITIMNVPESLVQAFCIVL